MPAPVADILAEADRLLEPARFEDYCVNGLQVPGPSEAGRIATGVSAHAELFEQAASANADLLLVHHGLFWGPGVRAIDAPLKRRLQILFDADIALAAYHLPLDAHPELGNNALLAHALGAEHLEPFGAHRGQTIGFLATLDGGGVEATRAHRPGQGGDEPRAALHRRRARASRAPRDRLRRGLGLRPRGGRRRRPGAPHRRAGRAGDGERQGAGHPRDRRRATTPPRPSASRRWASCSPAASGSSTSSSTCRTPSEPDPRRRACNPYPPSQTRPCNVYYQVTQFPRRQREGKWRWRQRQPRDRRRSPD